MEWSGEFIGGNGGCGFWCVGCVREWFFGLVFEWDCCYVRVRV